MHFDECFDLNQALELVRFCPCHREFQIAASKGDLSPRRLATRSPAAVYRIAIDWKVPYPSMLMKLNTLCGGAAVAGCNEALLVEAANAELLGTNPVRADTMAVPAEVGLPDGLGVSGQDSPLDRDESRRIQAGGGTKLTSRGTEPADGREGARDRR